MDALIKRGSTGEAPPYHLDVDLIGGLSKRAEKRLRNILDRGLQLAMPPEASRSSWGMGGPKGHVMHDVYDEWTRPHLAQNAGRVTPFGGSYVDPMTRARHAYVRGDIDVDEFERQVWVALNDKEPAPR